MAASVMLGGDSASGQPPPPPLPLNEAELEQLTSEPERSIYIYKWLQRLIKALPKANRPEIKESQKKVVEQLVKLVSQGSPGPPVRELLATALATLFSVGDTYHLFETVNKCNDLLKSKDDSPSVLPSRLGALVVVGTMYERLGRMMGRSYEETVQVLTRGLKNAESQTRAETMVTLGKVCKGMGGAASNVHKDIYKACRNCLTDRVMSVRVAAANCLVEMMQSAAFLYTTELESLAGLCFRAYDGTSYAARCAVARLLGTLIAYTQNNGDNRKQGMISSSRATGGSGGGSGGNSRVVPVEDALALLAQGFLKGGVGSFLMKGPGSGGSSPELRVGISQAYVVAFETLGSAWIEKQLPVILAQVLELATAGCRSGSSHTEVVGSRNCVIYILSAVLGRMLREKGQLSACKELTSCLWRSLNQNGGSAAGGSSEQGGSASDTIFTGNMENLQHFQIVALHQLGSLARRLGTLTTSLLTDTHLKLLDTVFGCLLSGLPAVRLAAAACLRQICVAVPSALTPLIDKCLESLESYKSSAEAVSGYSSGLAALLGAVPYTPNGVPHTRGKIIFNSGEELLRSASQNSRLCMERTRAGWLLIGAIMSLGPSVVKGLLPRCMLLWRNAFPRSAKDLESERARGDAFTWLVSLEARAGALASMHSFVVSCGAPELLTDDIVRRLAVPLESALSLLTLLAGPQSPVRQHAAQLRAPAATVRLRLLEVISVLHSVVPASVSILESSYAPLLRLLVGEITQADSISASSASGNSASSSSSTTTSLLIPLLLAAHSSPQQSASLLYSAAADDSNSSAAAAHLLLAAAGGNNNNNNVAETTVDQLNRFVEEQLQQNIAAGCGSLEHDHTWLYRHISPVSGPGGAAKAAGLAGVGLSGLGGGSQHGTAALAANASQFAVWCDALLEGLRLPWPLGIALIDHSVIVFGKIFPRAAPKHRLQMLLHFNQCIKSTKGNKLDALLVNVFSAILSGFKGLVEEKCQNFGGKEIVAATTELVNTVVTSANPLLRAAAGETLGRLALVVSDNKMIAQTAQQSFDFLKSARDVATRTGHSFALGCLHRHVGGLGSSQHLHTSVSILLALSQDNASPIVQAWALHSLALIADSGGPMFRGFVEPTLTCILKLLYSTPLGQTDVLICLGRLLAAIITTLGPELSVNDPGMSTLRQRILTAASVLQAAEYGQPSVGAEALSCLQQLHMFAPPRQQLELAGELLPRIIRLLYTTTQNSAAVCNSNYAAANNNTSVTATSWQYLSLRRAAVSCLRQMCQREAREISQMVLSLQQDGHCMDGGLMTYSDTGLPGMLFSLLDQEEDAKIVRDAQETLSSILTSLAAENLSTWLGLCKEILTVSSEAGEEAGKEDREEIDEDDATFTKGEDTSTPVLVQPRWATRVFAATCLRRIISDCCQGDRAHFDLGLAREVVRLSSHSHHQRSQTANTGLQAPPDFLVLHLTDLVRMCFMAATADSDPLRVEGLECMRVVIEKFADTEEPEFPGHVILEQYQAQVGAALRPAFAADTASHVTAHACAVCSTWISSGVARDLNDLRRVYQLLVTSLSKLKKGASSSCYNESASTLEQLSILQAWAEVYLVSMNSNSQTNSVPAASNAHHVLSKSMSGTSFPADTTNNNNINSGNTAANDNDDLPADDADSEDDDFGDFTESTGGGGSTAAGGLNATTALSSGALSGSGGAFTTSGGMSSSLAPGAGSGLSSLVAGELPSLSRYWLAAIRDHALLSLAPEFKSQLPYEGGAFYTNDTIELARPHYRKTWAPILQAGAVWLTHGRGFASAADELAAEQNNNGEESGGAGTSNRFSGRLSPETDDPEELNRSRFYLVLGVSMEALCSPRSGELTPSQLRNCIGALKALLESEEARGLLAGASDGSAVASGGNGNNTTAANKESRRQNLLMVEVCNVLHRQLLSLEDVPAQRLILSVVGLVVKAAADHLAGKKRAKLKELFPANQSITEIPPEVINLGEGGSLPPERLSAEDRGPVLIPGRSVVFGVLEVCLCVLVRYYADVSPKAAQSNSVIAMQARSRARSNRGSRLSSDQESLVAHALQLLASLPDLCSPLGAVTVAPTLLYLNTAVLQAAATKSPCEEEILADTPPVAAALDGIQKLVTMRYPQYPELEANYNDIIQSGLLRILDLVKTAPGSTKLDEISLLEAIKVYLLFGSTDIITDPNAMYPALNAFSTILQSQNVAVKRRCIKILRQVYVLNNVQVAVPYIQTTSPVILRNLLSLKAKNILDEDELNLNLDSLEVIELLIRIATPDKRSRLIDLYIPLLVHLLEDNEDDEDNAARNSRGDPAFFGFGASSAAGGNQLRRRQHAAALGRLTAIGGQFPLEFKTLLGENPQLKSRVERAVLLNQAQQRAAVSQVDQQARAAAAASQSQQPSIQLKTDFSNFT